MRKRSLLWDFISVKAGEGRVRKDRFALRDEEDVVGHVYPK
jgi:hypothetical protein